MANYSRVAGSLSCAHRRDFDDVSIMARPDHAALVLTCLTRLSSKTSTVNRDGLNRLVASSDGLTASEKSHHYITRGGTNLTPV